MKLLCTENETDRTNRSINVCKFPSDYLKNFDDLQRTLLTRYECVSAIKILQYAETGNINLTHKIQLSHRV